MKLHSLKIAAAAFAILLSCAYTASAAGKWGMAGCGVGALIFEDKPGKIQILSGTTNQYFAQSSSITSGTSGCVESRERVASLFIELNHDALKKDISRGNGETLASLSEILECDEQALSSALQRNFETIYPTSEAQPKGTPDRIKTTIRKNQQLSCKALS